jgi:hypothetical protein
VGVIEISDQQVRFVPITDCKKLTGAVLVRNRNPNGVHIVNYFGLMKATK